MAFWVFCSPQLFVFFGDLFLIEGKNLIGGIHIPKNVAIKNVRLGLLQPGRKSQICWFAEWI